MKYRNNSWGWFLVWGFFPQVFLDDSAGELVQKVLVPLTREKLCSK